MATLNGWVIYALGVVAAFLGLWFAEGYDAAQSLLLAPVAALIAAPVIAAVYLAAALPLLAASLLLSSLKAMLPARRR